LTSTKDYNCIIWNYIYIYQSLERPFKGHTKTTQYFLMASQMCRRFQRWDCNNFPEVFVIQFFNLFAAYHQRYLLSKMINRFVNTKTTSKHFKEANPVTIQLSMYLLRANRYVWDSGIHCWLFIIKNFHFLNFSF
jgi:hypothetical protein